MNTASPDFDPMFATHNPDLLMIWDILQRLQAHPITHLLRCNKIIV